MSLTNLDDKSLLQKSIALWSWWFSRIRLWICGHINREAVAEGSQAQARGAAAPGIKRKSTQSPEGATEKFCFAVEGNFRSRMPVKVVSVAPPGLTYLLSKIQALRRFVPVPGYLLSPLRGCGSATRRIQPIDDSERLNFARALKRIEHKKARRAEPVVLKAEKLNVS